MNPLYTLFFDLTVNGGWNLTAMVTWLLIVTMPVLAWVEELR